MKAVLILMQIAAAHDLDVGWCVLKRTLAVIMLSIFSMAAMASACCDTSPGIPPTHPVQAEYLPGDKTVGHHGGSSDHCQQTAGICAAPVTTAMAPSAFNPTLPDAASAPQHFHAAWLPLAQIWAIAAPLPLSLPLYLQTSRLLI